MVLGIRILTRSKAKFAKIRLRVQRYVVNVDADPGAAQPRKSLPAGNAGSILVPADDVKMPCGRTARIAPGQRKTAIGKQPIVAAGKRRALLDIVVEPPHLAATERGLN